MVFLRKSNKGLTPSQKGPKKSFQKEVDVDDNDAIVTKSPKGKKSFDEKRVSFQMSGKNTPAKTPVGKSATPAKNNSTSKKQPTPGRVGLQNQKSKKRSQPEDDDDDDDDDEDDFDFAPGMDIDMIGEDDDDEEDDDDDDEEDDDDDDEEDDDDDEEDNEENLKGQKLKAVQNKQTENVKRNNKQNAQKQTPTKGNAVVALDEKRKRERDAKQLYLGNLPVETTEKEIQSLSSDILTVLIPKRKKTGRVYAFLMFASEEKAEENFKKLKAKTFKGASLTLDYVGYKSSHKSPQLDSRPVSQKKLFISGLPVDVTVLQVAKLFPKCHSVSLNQSPSFRSATVSFLSAEDGAAALAKTKVVEINGVQASVMLSNEKKKITKSQKSKKFRQRKNKNGHIAKKMKLEE